MIITTMSIQLLQDIPNQAAIMAGLGGIVCLLLTHELLSIKQNTLAGLKKARDTERSEHTQAVYPPRSDSLNPTFP